MFPTSKHFRAVFLIEKFYKKENNGSIFQSQEQSIAFARTSLTLSFELKNNQMHLQ